MYLYYRHSTTLINNCLKHYINIDFKVIYFVGNWQHGKEIAGKKAFLDRVKLLSFNK